MINRLDTILQDDGYKAPFLVDNKRVAREINREVLDFAFQSREMTLTDFMLRYANIMARMEKAHLENSRWADDVRTILNTQLRVKAIPVPAGAFMSAMERLVNKSLQNG